MSETLTKTETDPTDYAITDEADEQFASLMRDYFPADATPPF
jgi:hypothetical protein